MSPTDISVICPVCGSDLCQSIDSLICKTGFHFFPVVKTIPDLRYPSVPYGDQILEMLEIYDNADFDDLLEIVVRNAKLPEKIITATDKYYQNQFVRAEKMTAMFLQRTFDVFMPPQRNLSMDLGCGSGGGVFALSKRFDTVFGVDSNLAQLLLAKKSLDKTGISNYQLICANAHALPYPHETFSYIQAINVLEHVKEFSGLLENVYTRLNVGGIFAADSRNRFDIFAPEPHTGIRFLGFLPRTWIPRLMRLFFGIQYENTRLLSYGELTHSLNNFFPEQYKIVFPLVRAYGKSAVIDEWINKIEDLAIINKLLLHVFTSHLVLAWKDHMEED